MDLSFQINRKYVLEDSIAILTEFKGYTAFEDRCQHANVSFVHSVVRKSNNCETAKACALDVDVNNLGCRYICPCFATPCTIVFWVPDKDIGQNIELCNVMYF